MSTYPGGKGGSGVYQKIISLMPKHRAYIECFLGNGSILRYKKPASVNVGIEIDGEIIKQFWSEPLQANFSIYNDDVIKFLKIPLPLRFDDKDILIYLDPPYLKSVRQSNRQIYRYELMSEKEHIELLEILLTLDNNVMISGYDSPLYNRILKDWRKVSFTGISRAGATTEVVWMNFDEPLELHDYSYLGDDYRQRENIKRQKQRWISKLKNMDPQKRYLFLSAFEELKTEVSAEPPMLDHASGR